MENGGARHGRGELTRFLNGLSEGRTDAAGKLMPFVYDELRALARAHLRLHRDGHTLQPTALVHEAFLRLFGEGRPAWNDRKHFFAFAAKTMRWILVDHARRRERLKRGCGRVAVTLDESAAETRDPPVDVLDVDEALDELATLDERQGRIVELRYFGGLAMEEVADVLAVSKSTVEREWRLARAWLGLRLEREPS